MADTITIIVRLESGEPLSLDLTEDNICGQSLYMDDSEEFTVTSLIHVNETLWGLLEENRWLDEFGCSVHELPDKIIPRGGRFSLISKKEAADWLLAHQLPLHPVLKVICGGKSLIEHFGERAARPESAPANPAEIDMNGVTPSGENGRDTARISDPTQVENGNRETKARTSKRKCRRRAISRKPTPLTEQQTEALHLLGIFKGNHTEAAHAAGKSRQAYQKLVSKAYKKLGQSAMKIFRTQSLPRDKRGQEMVPDPGN
jgi:hypothetical protein